MRVLDPPFDTEQVKLTYERAVKLIPELAGSPISAAWSGYVGSTRDGVPGIGEIPGTFADYCAITGFIFSQSRAARTLRSDWWYVTRGQAATVDGVDVLRPACCPALRRR